MEGGACVQSVGGSRAPSTRGRRQSLESVLSLHGLTHLHEMVCNCPSAPEQCSRLKQLLADADQQQKLHQQVCHSNHAVTSCPILRDLLPKGNTTEQPPSARRQSKLRVMTAAATADADSGSDYSSRTCSPEPGPDSVGDNSDGEHPMRRTSSSDSLGRPLPAAGPTVEG